jgi:hypothetical protein
MTGCHAGADDAHAISSLGGDNVEDTIPGRHCERNQVLRVGDVLESIANGSRIVSAASSKETLCVARFDAAFWAFHSKSPKITVATGAGYDAAHAASSGRS